jgi:ribose-phosphate pyrophosphokinase
MKLNIIDGGANTPLAVAIARILDVEPIRAVVARHPDLEANVQLLGSVAGDDLFIVQPTTPPADAHLMELLLLADAARQGRAARVTAVVPYFGYARQDHDCGRANGATLVAGLLEKSGIDGLVTVDLHSHAVETSARIPVSHLSSVAHLAERLRSIVPRESVVVAPDLGAVKLADRYARLLELPVAFVRKQRVSGSAVETGGIVGPVAGRTPIIVDDMISTGGTIVAAAEACIAAGAEATINVAASHGLFVGDAMKRLDSLSLRSLVTTDSVAAPAKMPGYVGHVTIAPLLAAEVARVHGDFMLRPRREDQ